MDLHRKHVVGRFNREESAEWNFEFIDASRIAAAREAARERGRGGIRGHAQSIDFGAIQIKNCSVVDLALKQQGAAGGEVPVIEPGPEIVADVWEVRTWIDRQLCAARLDARGHATVDPKKPGSCGPIGIVVGGLSPTCVVLRCMGEAPRIRIVENHIRRGDVRCGEEEQRRELLDSVGMGDELEVVRRISDQPGELNGVCRLLGQTD
jgi:hypothetical protein